MTTSCLFKIDLDPIFEKLTQKCLLAPQSTNPNEPSIIWEDTKFSIYDGSETERLWKLLQYYLDKYDSKNTQFRYHELVINLILANSNIHLPSWLISPYMVDLFISNLFFSKKKTENQN